MKPTKNNKGRSGDIRRKALLKQIGLRGGKNPGRQPKGKPNRPGVTGSREYPLDSQYQLNLARSTRNRDQGLAGLDRSQDYGQQDLTENLRRLAEQRVAARRSLQEGLNRQGLFYSGILGKRQGELDTDYDRLETDRKLAFDRAAADAAARRQALESDFELDRAQAEQDALDRQLERDADAAEARALGREGGGGGGKRNKKSKRNKRRR